MGFYSSNSLPVGPVAGMSQLLSVEIILFDPLLPGSSDTGYLSPSDLQQVTAGLLTALNLLVFL